MPDRAEANGDIVMGIAELLRREDRGVDSLPGMIKVMIDRESWRSFRDPKGKPHTYEPDEFEKFLLADPYDGLGLDPDRFVTYVRDDPALDARVRNLLTGKRGGDRKSKNRPIKPANIRLDSERWGTTTASTIRRLLNSGRGDLAAKVEAGELTAAAARREAGYKRLPYRSIRVDTPAEAVRALTRVFSPEQLRQALEDLDEGI